jgi:hypothetical protein
MKGRRTQRAGRALAALTAAAVLAAGCGGARNSLGTGASPCFRALPPARDAVSRKGKLLGVRKIKTGNLQKRLPGDTTLAGVTEKDLCVFAFKDTFQPPDVPLSKSKGPGTYAVVAVTIKHPSVVAAFILDRLPARFRHLQ